MALFLRAENLRVVFGIRTLFTIESLEIHDGDRVGLIGDNGAGKSTLLSVLHGDRKPDEGRVRRYAQSAMVRQFGAAETPSARDAAVFARFRARGEAHEGISGGELERLRIAAALSVSAPLLLADEPTTNLDFEGLSQVKQALLAHEGALVLVSHDRALLDAVCTAVWALEDGTVRVFPGGYTAYREQKARELDFARFEYARYRAEQARLRAAVVEVREASRGVRNTPKRMGNSEARLHKRGGAQGIRKKLDKTAAALESRLTNLEEKARPREAAAIRMGLAGRGGITSAVAVRAEGLRLAAGGKALLSDASFTLPTGRRTVLVGPNGCGKTTLLRAIRDGAEGIGMSPGATVGWFGQETLDTLDLRLTLLENVMAKSVLPAHEARTLMARMGLLSGDMDKPAAILSGGERAKAALARLMAGDATLLLLDEPGNHLDLRALEALEDMLAAYQGTLLLVTHDRRMIDRVAERLLLFEAGTLRAFDGTMSEYEAWRERQAAPPDNGLTEDILRMRMAALLARMSAPRKGEIPDNLRAEYDEAAARLAALLRKGQENGPR